MKAGMKNFQDLNQNWHWWKMKKEEVEAEKDNLFGGDHGIEVFID